VCVFARLYAEFWTCLIIHVLKPISCILYLGNKPPL
jgi:hypothetical protein